MNITTDLKGTIFECTGTIGGGGVFGNHYEVVAKDITLHEWLKKPGNHSNVSMGESRRCMEVQTAMSGGKMITQPFICFHGKFYLLTANHEHWGLFIPMDVSLHCVVPALIWLRLYGEKPQLEGPEGTYHYEPIVVGGQIMDGRRVVRHTK